MIFLRYADRIWWTIQGTGRIFIIFQLHLLCENIRYIVREIKSSDLNTFDPFGLRKKMFIKNIVPLDNWISIEDL